MRGPHLLLASFCRPLARPRVGPSLPAMKALFNRFNRGLAKDKSRSPNDFDTPLPAAPLQKEKIPQLPALSDWPPHPPPSETRTSIASFKPLPEISSRPLPPIDQQPAPPSPTTPAVLPSFRSPLYDVAEEDSFDPQLVTRTTSARTEQDSGGRSSRKTTNGSVHTANGSTDVHKKVAFISPPPTPSGPNASRPLPADTSAPTKTTVSRFQATHGKEPRGSTSTAASGSRTDVGSTKGPNSAVKVTSTRTANTPTSQKAYGDAASIPPSLRSDTPFSQRSAGGSFMPPASWSEGAEEDLVSNLGYRERTRQEVLWEIVASEERFVVDPLLLLAS